MQFCIFLAIKRIIQEYGRIYSGQIAMGARFARLKLVWIAVSVSLDALIAQQTTANPKPQTIEHQGMPAKEGALFQKPCIAAPVCIRQRGAVVQLENWFHCSLPVLGTHQGRSLTRRTSVWQDGTCRQDFFFKVQNPIDRATAKAAALHENGATPMSFAPRRHFVSCSCTRGGNPPRKKKGLT